MSSPWVAVGALLGFLGVALGAFGAHGAAKLLDDKSLEIFRTAAQYQMYHALALLGLGLWSAQQPSTAATVSGWCFTVGTLIFSGSLYALALSGIKMLGAITPIGGLLFMSGWLAFAFGAGRNYLIQRS